MLEQLNFLWFIFAIISIFSNVAIAETNQHFQKTNGNLIVFWRGVIPFICLTPIAFIIEWPDNPWFYIATIATAPISAYSDGLKFEAPKRFGAAVVSRVIPNVIWVTFFLWLLFSTEYREEFTENIQQVVLTILAMVLGFYGVMRMKSKCTVSYDALKFLSIYLILSSILNILNKTAMIHSSFWSGVILYAYIQSALIPIFKIVYNARSGIKLKDYFEPTVIKYGIIIGLLFIIASLSKNTSITMVTNPAYFVLINHSLQPIIHVYINKIIGRQDESDIPSGLMVVCSVLLLVIAENLL